ncbi:MAG TPA: PIN domain-containing protein [Vicinamibacteria bacterium]|nr:PIN domain-containing protein [Vicinamibacteria bacterium]
MSGLLLDTNVLSEVLKKRPSPRVLDRLKAAPRDSLSTSVVSVWELRHGATRHPQGTRLWERITREVLSLLPVLPLGEAEALCAGDLLATLDAGGRPIGIEDVLIGATALVQGLTVVTRNVAHLSRIPGLTVECWWD